MGRFSGGTPGIRLDHNTFIAVGHAVGDLSCFHQVGDMHRSLMPSHSCVPEACMFVGGR